jgi:hypothetical protein
VLGAGVPRLTVDSLMLLRGENDFIPLIKDRHFTVDTSTASRPVVRINDAGRQAACDFKDKEVRLRFFLSRPGVGASYPVAFERDGSFYFGGNSFAKRNGRWVLMGAFAAGFLFILFAAPRWRRVRRFVFDKEGVLQLVTFRLSFLLGYLLKVWPWWKRRIFGSYVAAFQDKYYGFPDESPAFDVVHCPGVPPENDGASADYRLRHVLEAVLAGRERLLWVEDAGSEQGRELLIRVARIARDSRLIPVLLDLADSSSLEEQIRREWEELGDVLRGVPKLWEDGGFLFLLDGSRRENDPAAVDRFLRDERVRNVVAVCRSSAPAEPFRPCHLRVLSSL